MTCQAIDLLFADRDGQRPSIFRVVRDSRNKAFMEEVMSSLVDRSRLRAEDAEMEKPKLSAIEDTSKV